MKSPTQPQPADLSYYNNYCKWAITRWQEKASMIFDAPKIKDAQKPATKIRDGQKPLKLKDNIYHNNKGMQILSRYI